MNWHNAYKRLDSLRFLEQDWDGYGTGAIEDDIIDFSSQILNKFEKSQKWDIEWIIPTSDGTVMVFLIHHHQNIFLKMEISEEDLGIAKWKNNERTYHDADINLVDNFI